ncbi:flavohemo protein [Lophiotrema nucula]|uniref:nitric oxide dioxygenase n=1 Tax=Lophiotrema nucula TaxID=690887 RepID=A0A6A5ZC67_9PLEO|nr:flavohemo protein [Lophiotrema nucula]
MAPALTPAQAAVIKATVPVLVQYGETITTKFYADMLEAHPELHNIFNNVHQKTGHQPRALAGALYAYAANIDNLGVLSPALELICQKHTSLYIRPEHYEVVGTHLLQTMKTVLGAAATGEILDAWEAAYWQLAHIMINKEAQLYETTNGWTDWKDFKIAKKVKESEDITSFYFEPVDANLKIPVFKPGQYISVNVFVDELYDGVWQARQYSLSDAPGKDYLRISVKKEPGLEIGDPKSKTHPGYISNILHEKKNEGDVVRLSHPFGDFFFEETEENKGEPVVLISAGVGLTALLSILNHLTEQHSSRPVTWVHGARTANHRAFKPHLDRLNASNSYLKTVLFTSSPSNEEAQGEHFDITGRVDLSKLSAEDLYTSNPKTQYYTCGPTEFMVDVEAKLNAIGVPSERIKMELFGTGGVPRV